ncbi:2-C-methyl-D-erythritol 4-phosphate cytidylyltransferase [Sedimentitalea sp. JM2-8]|uniref:2-C-methyl-D-erythritol 4-phosphate cytidylyltransferase n=1 Tax=Sedimentitalea xiamensis TaxID=3050037 RepID=A0ABT7FCU9_9RHOB|nr:2-C-methyl-D-erythritol 4-phosphate cytidylyltransferase [Sedimentitalea xiamensis]MDK3072843.1 2-C-methyl-D-erythritol 4-phosphate cytidylyltransferase [Sedimentitalea xiamensis]
MTTAALIVAAGRGRRAGGPFPKQWREIAGAPVAEHTLRAFEEHGLIGLIAIVLHPDDLTGGNAFQARGIRVAHGGADRAESVRNGLAALAGQGVDKVLIHDVARPCVTRDVISGVIAALEDEPGAAPALAVTDALWQGANGFVTGTQDRAGLYRAQTPQGFHYDAICAAHAAHPGGAADDVEVARAAGMRVAIVPGDEDNLKITLPGDFDRADRILRARNGH